MADFCSAFCCLSSYCFAASAAAADVDLGWREVGAVKPVVGVEGAGEPS